MGAMAFNGLTLAGMLALLELWRRRSHPARSFAPGALSRAAEALIVLGLGLQALTLFWPDLVLRPSNQDERSLELVLLAPLTFLLGALLSQVATLAPALTSRHRTALITETEDRFRQYFESSLIGLAETSIDKKWIRINSALCRMLGYEREQLLGTSWTDVTHEEDLGSNLQAFEAAVAGKIDEYTLEKRFWHRSGQLIHAIVSVRVHRLVDGKVDFLFVSIQDISQQKRREDQARLREATLESILRSAPIGIAIVEPGRRFTRVNQWLCDRLEASEAELLSQSTRLLYASEAEFERVGREKRRMTEECGGGSLETQLVARSGEQIDVLLVFTEVDRADPQAGAIVTLLDITQRKRYEEKLLQQASYDALTGLPNRSLVLDRLRHALRKARREKRAMAVLFLDLNDFKEVNDSYGHAAGDELLRQSATRFRSALREGDTVGRLGGDEFIMLLCDLRDSKNAGIVADKIIKSLEEPFTVLGHECFVSAAVGLAVFPHDGEDAESLLRCADAAMYHAKTTSKSERIATYRFYTADMNRIARERLELEQKLRHALTAGEFFLVYLPMIEVRSGKVCGAEALLRWRRPTLEAVAPESFLPLAEQTGLIHEIGEWVLRTVCQQWKEWQDVVPEQFTVGVNLSARQFRGPPLQDLVKNVLSETGVPGRCLELEVTEDLFLEEVPDAEETLLALSQLGATLVLDDFGTGLSAMGHFRKHHFDVLKIDRSFIHDSLTNQSSAALISAIVTMARTLGLSVTAEGAETPEQVRFLTREGCHRIQGYYFTPPLEAHQLVEFAKQQFVLPPPERSRPA